MADKNIFANSGSHKPDIPTSVFDWSHRNNGTFRFGRIYPVDVRECPPGTTFKCKPHAAFDMMPFAFPIQTSVKMHLRYYAVPFRILAKDMDKWLAKDGSDQMPWIDRPAGWAHTGSLADYMGLPTTKLSQGTDFLQPMRFGIGHPRYTAPTSPGLNFDDLYSHVTGLPYYSMMLSANWLFQYPVQGRLKFMFYTASSISPTSPADLHAYTYLSNIQTGKFMLGPDVVLPYVADITTDPSTACYGFLPTEINQAVSRNGVTFYKHILTIFTGELNYNDYNGQCVFSLWWKDNATSVEEYGDWFGSSSNFAPSIFSENDAGTYLFWDYTKDPADWSNEEYCNIIGFINTGLAESPSVNFVDPDADPFSTAVGATKPVFPINALPFRAYEMIYNFKIRNQNIDPFILNGQIQRNRFITNDQMGADDTTPIDFKYANFEVDYFTSCLNSPQFGNAPLVGVTYHDDDVKAIMHYVDADGTFSNNMNKNTGGPSINNPYSTIFTNPTPENAASGYKKFDISVEVSPETGKVTGIGSYSEDANKTSVLRLKEAIDFGISINDLRNANALQQWLERYQRAGSGRYQDIVEEFYGTTPPIGNNYPILIGGIDQDISVDKIQNTAESEKYPLGSFAGTGHFVCHGNEIKHYCPEQTYIMALMWFSVVPCYSQILPKHFLKMDQLEYYNPVFRNIGLQPVLKCEIAPLQLPSDHSNDIFGYNRPYADYCSVQDEVHGDFRDNMSGYVLQRTFGSAPDLSPEFLQIHPEALTDIFAEINDNDKIFGQLYFDEQVKLQLPHFHIPQLES